MPKTGPGSRSRCHPLEGNRTYRLRTPADFFKQEAVRFERARIDMNGSIVADGHNLSLYGVVLLRRDKICTAAEGAR